MTTREGHKHLFICLFFIAINSLTCVVLLLSLSPKFVADPEIGDFRGRALHRTGSGREVCDEVSGCASELRYITIPRLAPAVLEICRV